MLSDDIVDGTLSRSCKVSYYYCNLCLLRNLTSLLSSHSLVLN